MLRLLDAGRNAINLASIQRFPIHQPRETLVPPDLGNSNHRVRQYVAVALTFVDFAPI
jgi:hypothetical protein